jgi:hypothetical protein
MDEMKIDEAKLLENLSRVIGAEHILEEKKKRWEWEQALLEKLSSRLDGISPSAKSELPPVREEDPAVLPEVVLEASQKPQEPLSSDVVVPTTQLTEDLQDLPQVPVNNMVNQTVAALSKAPQSAVQQVADQIPDSYRKELDILKKSILDLHRFAQRHSQMGGGGEVNLRYLDDIDRSSIYSGRYLRYNGTSKKFEFSEVNPHDVVYNTARVTSSFYQATAEDYYIGVNYAGPVTIELPEITSSGRNIVVKDESGNCGVNNITINAGASTIDNDGDAILTINNGSLTFIFRDGWRII